jgi:hypothetical protein
MGRGLDGLDGLDIHFESSGALKDAQGMYRRLGSPMRYHKQHF